MSEFSPYSIPSSPAEPHECTHDAAPPASRLEAAIEVLRNLRPQVSDVETVSLQEALGRISAGDIAAAAPLPRFDHSAVDGYGLAPADTGQAPLRLRVLSRLAAGDEGAAAPAPGEALRLMTGARLPGGIGAVVPDENCRRDGATLLLPAPARAGSNIRRMGEDVAAGATIVPAGIIVDPRHIALLGAAGVARLAVRRRIRVAVLSNGNELREPGETLRCSQIYDCNRPMLLAALAQPWLDASDAGCHADEPDALSRAFAAAAGTSDIVISSGGVAGSDADHVAAAVAAAGGQMQQFHLPLKPGKAILAGTIGDTAILGLAGNPVAALVGLLLFGRALTRAVAGLLATGLPGYPAEALEPFPHVAGRVEFVPGKITGIGAAGLPRIALLPAGSARLRPLATADGLAALPADVGDLRPGTRITFHPLPAAFAG